MCGILGVVINKMSSEVIRNLYDIFIDQKNRGIAGAGISINDDKGLYRYRSVSPFRLFNAYNEKVWSRLDKGSRVMIHHRFPTSTDNEPKYNHPMATEDKRMHLIHNGHIFNWDELYKKLKKKHKFETHDGKIITDSEVILHIIEDNIKGKDKIKALSKMYDKVSGSFALAIQWIGDDKIYLVKHNNPIVISQDDDGNYYFSSELSKRLGLKEIHSLAEGEIGVLDKKGYKKLKQKKVYEYKESKTTKYGGFYNKVVGESGKVYYIM